MKLRSGRYTDIVKKQCLRCNDFLPWTEMIRHKEYDYCIVCYDKWVVRPREREEEAKEVLTHSRTEFKESNVTIYDKEFLEKYKDKGVPLKYNEPKRPTQSIICLPTVTSVSTNEMIVEEKMVPIPLPKRENIARALPVEPGTFGYLGKGPVYSPNGWW